MIATRAAPAALLLAATAALTAAPALNPHVNPSVNRVGCPACHKGHGVSRSPMLSGPLAAGCNACHGTRAGVDKAIAAGILAAGVNPPLLATVLAQPYVHPISIDALSSEEVRKVTCTSCHSAHRSMPLSRSSGVPTGSQYVSTKDPQLLEYALCESCHGNAGTTTQNRTDISRLLNPSNRSFHPVEGIANSRSASVIPSLVARQINCTDCHGSDDPRGPKGPHGSRTRFILRYGYSIADGGTESAELFALCYSCHSRKSVLEMVSFPSHGKHIREIAASCSTCHNPHGSLNNLAMIKFGEETTLGGVQPSVSAGRLAFVSSGTGSGSCYLTCHGKDHGPLSYGPREGRKPGLSRSPLTGGFTRRPPGPEKGPVSPPPPDPQKQ